MNKQSYSMILGKNIKRLRKDQGFSQEAFANEAGLSRSFLGCIERGEKNVTATNLIKIAIALKVQVAAFFPEIEDKYEKEGS